MLATTGPSFRRNHLSSASYIKNADTAVSLMERDRDDWLAHTFHELNAIRRDERARWRRFSRLRAQRRWVAGGTSNYIFPSVHTTA